MEAAPFGRTIDADTFAVALGACGRVGWYDEDGKLAFGVEVKRSDTVWQHVVGGDTRVVLDGAAVLRSQLRRAFDNVNVDKVTFSVYTTYVYVEAKDVENNQHRIATNEWVMSFEPFP
jgi:hypothetical protein